MPATLMPATGQPAMLVARPESARPPDRLPNREVCEGPRRSLLLAWQLSADERPVYRALFVVAAQRRPFVCRFVLTDHLVFRAGGRCSRRGRIGWRKRVHRRRVSGVLDIRFSRLEAGCRRFMCDALWCC
jgi:hypothetical protein